MLSSHASITHNVSQIVTAAAKRIAKEISRTDGTSAAVMTGLSLDKPCDIFQGAGLIYDLVIVLLSITNDRDLVDELYSPLLCDELPLSDCSDELSDNEDVTNLDSFSVVHEGLSNFLNEDFYDHKGDIAR